MRRAAVVATALGCAVPLAVPVPALADGELVLSHDGRHWVDRLQRPLFDPDVRWVPGDVRRARFYLRNDAPDPGLVSMDVERTRRVALVDTGFLRMAARADGGPWTTITTDGVSRLVDEEAIRSGRAVPVDVRVSMGIDAPNGTMVLSSDLDFRVTVRDARSAAVEQPTSSGSGVLPDTGSAVAPWVPPLGLGLVVAGWWLTGARRRRRDDTTAG
ncbi:LPXTG cell wall anchor domain-containing protein [Nocardioides litoris]|uniref:LPXTG cell wall anchor domain-containing protein n=1 Tax=Nocardioides litoris TaxID=1926648 RepID=UPI001124A3DA|nr:LPXTG cell wall anchor domain-containing protein [Nocardioides litoris]